MRAAYTQYLHAETESKKLNATVRRLRVRLSKYGAADSESESMSMGYDSDVE